MNVTSQGTGQNLRKRWIVLILSLGVAFLVMTVASVILGRFYVRRQINRQLEFSTHDLYDSFAAVYEYALTFEADALVRHFGTLDKVRGLSRKDLLAYATLYGLDEINFVDTNKCWAATTETNVRVGERLDASSALGPLLEVLRPEVQVAVQPFRQSISDPTRRLKYLASSFYDDSGFVEVGYDELRIEPQFERLFANFTQGWHIGNEGYLIIVQPEDGTIFRSGRPFKGKTLTEIGACPVSELAKLQDESVRFNLEGNLSWCRVRQLGGHYFLVVVPMREYLFEVVLFLILPVCMTLILAAVAFSYLYRDDRRRLEESRRVQEIEQRRLADMHMAQAIQRSALPVVFPPYPQDFMMDVFARMDPARDVGGDFYDFHYVGADRLAFLVADVSGKGIPAAMFMMKAKTLLHALSVSMMDLADAVAEANERLCEGNTAEMFVTCWIGVLDERTGMLHYVNAGHNPPYLIHAQSAECEELGAVSGLFLGGMPGMRYKMYSLQLQPNDTLFLYTDGVTEANNLQGEMFGEKRLVEVLEGKRGLGLSRFGDVKERLQPSPEVICHRVRGAVDAFVGSGAQFDDITMLALRYRESPLLRTMTIPAKLEGVGALSRFVEKLLVAENCPQAVKADVLVALDEIANNVATYSGSETMSLQVEIARNPGAVRLCMIDSGKPWNPLVHLDPDITLPADDREIGGLGILMVKRLMDDVSYVYRDGQNVLTVRKAFGNSVYRTYALEN